MINNSSGPVKNSLYGTHRKQKPLIFKESMLFRAFRRFLEAEVSVKAITNWNILSIISWRLLLKKKWIEKTHK